MATHIWFPTISVLLTVLFAVKSTVSLIGNRVYTQKDVYKVSERIEVICNITSSHVDLRNVLLEQYQKAYNETSYLKPTKVLNNTVMLVIPSSTIQNGGTYRCIERRYNRYIVLTTIPKTFCVIDEVVEPKSFTCVNYFNENKLVCSWDTDQITYWKLNLKVADTDENFTICKQTEYMPNLIRPTSCPYYPEGQCNNNRNNSCILWLADAGFIYDRIYEFRLTGCNRIGARIWTYTQNINQSIVKLNPVTNLKVYPHRKHIKITWDLFYPPSTWVNGLQCIVYYYNQLSDINKMEFLEKCVNVTLIHDIPFLKPYANYTISVSCRPFGSNYSSDNTTIYTTTLQDVPLAGPDFVPGGFSFYSCHGSKTCLALYWQNLDVMTSQGDVISYFIMVNSSSGESHLFHNVSSQGQSVNLKFPVDEDSVYDVFGWTLNSQGISQSYSYMRIPSRNKAPLCIKHEYQSTTNSYKLWYNGFGDNSMTFNVTFYWCQGIVERPLVLCQSNLNWRQTTNTSVLIPANPAAVNFAVSINIDGESTGIVWNQCLDRDIGTFHMTNEATIGASIGGTVCLILFLALCLWCVQKCYRKVKNYDPEVDPPTIAPFTGQRQIQDAEINIASNVNDRERTSQPNRIYDGDNRLVPSERNDDKISDNQLDIEEPPSDQNKTGQVTNSETKSDLHQYVLVNNDSDTSAAQENVSNHDIDNQKIHPEKDVTNSNVKSVIVKDIQEQQIRSRNKEDKSDLSSKAINSYGEGSIVMALLSSSHDLDKEDLKASRDNMIENQDNGHLRGLSNVQHCVPFSTNMSPTQDHITLSSLSSASATHLFENGRQNENSVINSDAKNTSESRLRRQSKVSSDESSASEGELEKRSLLPKKGDTDRQYILEYIERPRDQSQQFTPENASINRQETKDKKKPQAYGCIEDEDDIIHPRFNENIQSVLSKDSMKNQISDVDTKLADNQLSICKIDNRFQEPSEYVSNEKIKAKHLISENKDSIYFDQTANEYKQNKYENNDGPPQHVITWNNLQTDMNVIETTNTDEQNCEKLSMRSDNNEDDKHEPNVPKSLGNCVDKNEKHSEGNKKEIINIRQTVKPSHESTHIFLPCTKNNRRITNLPMMDKCFDSDYVQHDTILFTESQDSADLTSTNELTQGNNGNNGDLSRSSVCISRKDNIKDDLIEQQMLIQDDLHNSYNGYLEHKLNRKIKKRPCRDKKYEDLVQTGCTNDKAADPETNAQLEKKIIYSTKSPKASLKNCNYETDINLSDSESRPSAFNEIGSYVKVHTSNPETSVYLSKEQISPVVFKSKSRSKFDSAFIDDKMSDGTLCEIMSNTPEASLCKTVSSHSHCSQSKSSFKITDNTKTINGYVPVDMLKITDEKIDTDSFMTTQL